jgi:hypothetical protein
MLKLVPHVFLCIFPDCRQKYADGKMAYSNVLTVSVMCTDKQDLVSVKFCLNGYEF